MNEKTELLEKALLKSGISKRKLARLTGISHPALYSKLKNATEFKASEIVKIAEALNLSASERDRIFLCEIPTQKKPRRRTAPKTTASSKLTYRKTKTP